MYKNLQNAMYKNIQTTSIFKCIRTENKGSRRMGASTAHIHSPIKTYARFVTRCVHRNTVKFFHVDIMLATSRAEPSRAESEGERAPTWRFRGCLLNGISTPVGYTAHASCPREAAPYRTHYSR